MSVYGEHLIIKMTSGTTYPDWYYACINCRKESPLKRWFKTEACGPESDKDDGK